MANAKILEQKQMIIDEIKDKVNNSNSIVLFDYHGITDSEIKELRIKLREAGADYKVYKNTLTKRALDELNINMDDYLSGPSAISFGTDELSIVKVINDFAKEHEALELKAGIVEGKVVDADTIVELSKLPNREGMISMLLGCLQAPVRDFACVIKAVADQKEENA